ncbi:hypothetical protein O0I10_009204 [Lichtheimia ornata]|uniref:Yeast cell wall synthesis Kre9/Knh1-like N-terminal domain-containing protein n=1 Tax=Lichtheimia ornata TaxID=688661 RepID=A0AAD7UYC0_9FUNG|nr:uncharacterized protein O0I10_009204 [Lichtheimia ornata]KAJ8655169.1 hypothetical protein O0I10_009204 [Lichtheimia ornata]
MKFALSLAAVAAFVAAVSAQGISVINPTLGAKWPAGSKQTITWNVDGAKTVTGIVLRQGDANNLNTLYTISSDQIDASEGKYEWTIQSDTKPSNDYAVQVTTDQGQQYSPFFEITAGGDSGSGSSNSTSSDAPSASGSAAASGSSAAASGSSSASGSAAASGSASASGSAAASGSASSSAKPTSASASGSADSSSSSAAASSDAAENDESAGSSFKVNAALGVAAGAAALALF